MEQAQAFGFLTDDGTLYCSQACAQRVGKRAGREVDQTEYGSFCESETIAPVSICPGCGNEFAVVWPGHERE